MAPSLSDPAPLSSMSNSQVSTTSAPPKKVRPRLETDQENPSSDMHEMPKKRPKVAFDSDVRIKVLHGWDDDFNLTRNDVRQVIERHRAGDDQGYNRLKELFTTRPGAENAPSSASLRNHLLALTSVVSRLGRFCSDLVHAILDCQWLGREEPFVSAYIRFVGSLVSAQGAYVGAVLNMLVDDMTAVPPSLGILSDNPTVTRSQIYARTHMALKYILQLVPSSTNALSPLLSAAFPNFSSSRRAHTTYVKNLLKLIRYAPELKSEVLSLITERLVKIDVQVQVDTEDLEEESDESLVRDEKSQPASGEIDTEGEFTDSDTESTSTDSSIDEESRRIRDIRANVGKMDAILDLLFRLYSPSFATPSSTESIQVFEMLLNQFATIILPTYRSRHSQFLLFHFAQASPLLIDKFAGACVHLAFDRSRPALLKQSSAAYLASFVARGAHVSAQVVRDVFDLLGSQLDNIRQDHEASCRGPDLRRFGTFYSMVQALLYIFCFRWRDLLSDDEDGLDYQDATTFEMHDITWVPGIRDILTRTIYSKFNPLKVCSPPIVNEFARIANHLRFMYIYPLLESNKRLQLPKYIIASAARPGYGGPDAASIYPQSDNHQQLDAYFPFDPYNLPVSKRWLRGDYVEWQGVPGLDDVGRDEGDSDSD